MNEWYDFRAKCPCIICPYPYQSADWIHKSCGEHQKINGYGQIQCLKNLRGEKCLSPTFILDLRFKCDDGKHINYRKDEGDEALDPILVAVYVTTLPKKFRIQLVEKINHYDDDYYTD